MLRSTDQCKLDHFTHFLLLFYLLFYPPYVTVQHKTHTKRTKGPHTLQKSSELHAPFLRFKEDHV